MAMLQKENQPIPLDNLMRMGNPRKEVSGVDPDEAGDVAQRPEGKIEVFDPPPTSGNLFRELGTGEILSGMGSRIDDGAE